MYGAAWSTLVSPARDPKTAVGVIEWHGTDSAAARSIRREAVPEPLLADLGSCFDGGRADSERAWERDDLLVTSTRANTPLGPFYPRHLILGPRHLTADGEAAHLRVAEEIGDGIDGSKGESAGC
jgi:hypothetical protein